MLIAFEGGRLELQDERPHKLIEAVQRVQGVQALNREFNAFVSATRHTLAVSQNFGRSNGSNRHWLTAAIVSDDASLPIARSLPSSPAAEQRLTPPSGDYPDLTIAPLDRLVN